MEITKTVNMRLGISGTFGVCKRPGRNGRRDAHEWLGGVGR